MSASGVDRRTAAGDWEIVLPGVYLLDGAPRSWDARFVAAGLWAGQGSALSHHAAAAYWRMDGFPPSRIAVTTRRALKSTSGVEVHRVANLAAAAVDRRESVSVTTPARTLLDLAAVESKQDVERALDGALRDGLVSLPKLRWYLTVEGGRGRNGTATIRKLLDARPSGYVPPHSPLEARLWELVVGAGLPLPVRQHVVRAGRRFVARVDLAYPDVLVAIEADGYRWHSGRREWTQDLARRNRLTALGWRVLHVTHQDLDRRPEELVGLLREMLAERLLLCP